MMRIDVSEYKLVLNDSEMYTFIFALQYEMFASIEHYKNHNGIDAFYDQWEERLGVSKQLCFRIGREDMHNNFVKRVEAEFEE